MQISEFQRLIRETYGERDRERGVTGTFVWFVEEVGELSRALFRGDVADQRAELADVLAWLVTVADQAGIDLEEAAGRYAHGCPKCGQRPCVCPHERTTHISDA